MQHQTRNVMRLACLVAVLLVGSAWQCSANEDTETEWKPLGIREKKTPSPPPPLTYSEKDKPNILRIVEAARKALVIAESANKLTADATKQSKKLHTRAEIAVNATAKAAKEVEAIAKSKKNSAALKVAQDANMAAEIARELYGNATANPTLIEEHAKWFKLRHDRVKELEPTLSAAIKALEESNSGSDTTKLVNDVLSPARRIFNLAQNAANDARYIAQKLLYTEMLAEKVEVLQDFAEKAKEGAENNKAAETKESCTAKHGQKNAVDVFSNRQPVAKAYLQAFAAHKIAAKCGPRISANTTKATEMYYALKDLLVKMKEADYKKTYLYRSIADDARRSVDEFKRVAASTSENAAIFMKEAHNALNSITSCVSEQEAKWYKKMAHKASSNALSEMHLAMYQLFASTVSLQQMTDAKLEVENISKSGTAEESSTMTGLKEEAINSEKKAEESYLRVKAYDDEVFEKLHRVEEIVKQARRLMAQRGTKDSRVIIERQLQVVRTAMRAVRVSSKQVQKAASSVHDHYNKTKAAADSALGAFAQAKVEAFQKAAVKAMIATEESEKINAPKAMEELKKVTQLETRAQEAYKEARHVTTESHKATRRAE